jgi:calcineurin-like phosphoesterase family protein
MTLCHFPMEEWNKRHYNAYHIHAHSHGVKEPRVGKKILDVGVDSAKKLLGEYRPFSLEEVVEIMEKR